MSPTNLFLDDYRNQTATTWHQPISISTRRITLSTSWHKHPIPAAIHARCFSYAAHHSTTIPTGYSTTTNLANTTTPAADHSFSNLSSLHSTATTIPDYHTPICSTTSLFTKPTTTNSSNLFSSSELPPTNLCSASSATIRTVLSNTRSFNSTATTAAPTRSSICGTATSATQLCASTSSANSASRTYPAATTASSSNTTSAANLDYTDAAISTTPKTVCGRHRDDFSTCDDAEPVFGTTAAG